MPPRGATALRIVTFFKGCDMTDAKSASEGLKVARSLRGRTAHFHLEGELSAQSAYDVAQAIESACRGIVEGVVVNLEECDLEGAEAVSAFVRSVKALLNGGRRVTLYGPSQMLAHNLYRAGLTRGAGALRLISLRSDEPTSP